MLKPSASSRVLAFLLLLLLSLLGCLADQDESPVGDPQADVVAAPDDELDVDLQGALDFEQSSAPMSTPDGVQKGRFQLCAQHLFCNLDTQRCCHQRCIPRGQACPSFPNPGEGSAE